MAEAIIKYFFGKHIYVASVSLRAGEPDGFMIEVMDEIGIDLSQHKSKTFENLEDISFDVIISLSPEAQHRAVELTRNRACEVEFWNTFDPSLTEGNREARLNAYRQVRDGLMERLEDRFERPSRPI